MKFSIVVFPGSNCERDCEHVVSEILGCEAQFIWHQDETLKGCELVVLPGGFAYGDYLRAGALARFSPVMEGVARFAKEGGPVLGICNGFQVLLEAGLLPGAMRVNRGLRYVCRDVHLKLETADTPFTRLYERGAVVKMPVGHMEGNYTAAGSVLDELEAEGRIVFRYCDEFGQVTDASNPNGAERGIAGICSRERNVVGLMPHPDRCSEPLLGNAGGLKMFQSAVEALSSSVR